MAENFSSSIDSLLQHSVLSAHQYCQHNSQTVVRQLLLKKLTWPFDVLQLSVADNYSFHQFSMTNSEFQYLLTPFTHLNLFSAMVSNMQMPTFNSCCEMYLLKLKFFLNNSLRSNKCSQLI